MSDDASEPKPIKGLPFAHGRAFACLDDYLDHLRERAGPIGQPWYRELRPDLYERVTSLRGAGASDVLTRVQLLARFGFRC